MHDIKKYFGAKGDGTSDDTQAIYNAFNSSKSPIFFPPGRYAVRPGAIERGWSFPQKNATKMIGAGNIMRSTQKTQKYENTSVILPIPDAVLDPNMVTQPLIIDDSDATQWESITFRGIDATWDGTGTPNGTLHGLFFMRGYHGSEGTPNFNAVFENCAFQYAHRYGIRLDRREWHGTVADFSMYNTWFEQIKNPDYVQGNIDDVDKQMACCFWSENEQAISMHFYHTLCASCDLIFHVAAGGNIGIFGGGSAWGRCLIKAGRVKFEYTVPGGSGRRRHGGLAGPLRGIAVHGWKIDAQGPRFRLFEDLKNSVHDTQQGRSGGCVTFEQIMYSHLNELGDNFDADNPTPGSLVDWPIVINYGGHLVIIRDSNLSGIIPDRSPTGVGGPSYTPRPQDHQGKLAKLSSGNYATGGRPALLLVENTQMVSLDSYNWYITPGVGPNDNRDGARAARHGSKMASLDSC